MIIAKIDSEAFIDTVQNARIIAFQRLDYGYAVAAPLIAFYAPIEHPGGGNLDKRFIKDLGMAFIRRLSDPYARTLRPKTKPIPTARLRAYLDHTFGSTPEPMEHYSKAPGDHPTVIESECQEVIRTIETYGDPELEKAIEPAKRDAMSDALDLVIQHAEAGRELAEVGDYRPEQMRLQLLQASRAMQTALEFLLR